MHKLNDVASQLCCITGDKLPMAKDKAATAEPVEESTSDDFGKGLFEEDNSGDQGAPVDEAPTVSATEPEETAVEPAAPAEPESPTLSSTLSDLGFRDVESEEDAQARLLKAYQEQINQAAALEQRVREAEIRAAVQNMPQPNYNQPEAEQKTDSPVEYWPQYPTIDPQMVSKYRETFVDPETSQVGVRWSADAPSELKSNYDRYTAEVEQWTNKLAYEPQQTLQPIIEDLAERKVRDILQSSFGFAPEEISSRLDLSGEQAKVNAFMQQYGDKLYEMDPVTKSQTDRLTDFGRKVDDAMVEAYHLGLQSQSSQLHYAQRALSGEFAALSGAASQATAQEVREERKLQKQQRGGNTSRDLSGSLPKHDDEVQNSNLTPGQALAAAMREAGEL